MATIVIVAMSSISVKPEAEMGTFLISAAGFMRDPNPDQISTACAARY
jgi:hypothetical protein